MTTTSINDNDNNNEITAMKLHNFHSVYKTAHTCNQITILLS